MKNILIVTRKLGMGGVETSLISMLKCIPRDKYNIKILTIYPGGELIDEIPEWINVETVPEITTSTLQKMGNRFRNFDLIGALKILVCTLLSKKTKSIKQSYKYNLKTLITLKEKYDLAISYYNPTSFTIAYVINNVIAKKKVMWIHNDVNLYKDINDYKEFYYKYDYIYNVSEDCMNKFIKIFPELRDKTSVFYNIIDEEKILNKANEERGVLNNNYEVKIVTVARLSIEKGQDMIPWIVRRLINEGINVGWYCVGEGTLRSEIEKNIKKYNVMNNVILLGNKNNPYPYINECDIYVQTSRSECFCTTVMEAKCLKKPMVITDVNGSREQIKNNIDGFIAKINSDDIYEKVKCLIINKEKRSEFKEELDKNKINTEREMEKLYKLL